jgi:hypothetical protein
MTITTRIDHTTQITPEFLNPTPPAPRSVKIELSPRCNLRCGFCSLRTREHQPDTDMDFDLFKRMTRDMVAAGVEEIGIFYLGESLMNPDLAVAAVAYLKNELHVPYVFLTSNAVLATPPVVRRLMIAGLDSLKWSVNAADEAQYKEIMGVAGKNFHTALANIKWAKAVREVDDFKCGLYASSIRFDGEQHERMQAMLAEHVLPYVDEAYELPLYGMSLTANAVKERIGYAPTHGNMGRVDPATGLPNRDPLPCWSAFMEGHVRVDGHMSICCFGSDERFDVGDLSQQTFMEAWHSPAAQRIREAQIRTLSEGPSALAGTMCAVCAVSGEAA